MDLLDRVMEYLEANVSLNAPIVPGLLGEGSSIAIRLTPGSINTRFITGFNADVGFQILVQDKNHLKCVKVTEDIFRALDGLSRKDLVSQDDSFKLVHLTCSTLPNFVEKTNQGLYIYTAIFNAEIEY